MATLAFAALGAWMAPVGYAAWGWTIGSLIGSRFAASKQHTKFTNEGSRIQDLRAQESKVGADVQKVAGTVRLAGNVIWSTSLKETQHVDRQKSGGGKGGGGGSTTTTTITYTYSQSLAIGLCEGPIVSVTRIWANGKLIFDIRPEAGAKAVAAAQLSLERGSIRIYPGSESQTPDTLIQGYQGVAGTPAYRGLAYIVFNDLQLESFGNRAPNFEFEVIKGASGGTTDLATLVASICDGAGLTSYNVSNLAGKSVEGFYVPLGTTLALQLQPLQNTFLFDSVELDGVLFFVNRNATAVASIPESALQTMSNGEVIEITRVEESELPREVAIRYLDRGSEYQQSVQYARRYDTSKATSVLDMDLPVVMSSNYASALAQKVLWDMWVGRVTYKVLLSKRYAHLTPTDVIEITVGNATYLGRIASIEESEGLLSVTLSKVGDGTYTQEGADSTVPRPPQTVVGLVETSWYFLDIPRIDVFDDEIGLYVFAGPTTNVSWPGAAVYRSIDGGITYDLYSDTIKVPHTTGVATTRLGFFRSGNMFDDMNIVEVDVSFNELESISTAEVLQGLNLALLGRELIQFRDAELVAPGRYILSGLLRGCYGTEWAIDTHEVGEAFVMMDSALRLSQTIADVEVAYLYKVATEGTFIEDAEEFSVVNTGASLKPYAPAHLGGGRSGDDVLIHWVRRARTGGEWLNGRDVALDEPNEAYEIEIWDNGFTSLMRTLYASSPAVTYPSAAQVEDFGTPPNQIGVRVFQMNALIGRGYPASTVI